MPVNLEDAERLADLLIKKDRLFANRDHDRTGAVRSVYMEAAWTISQEINRIIKRNMGESHANADTLNHPTSNDFSPD